MGVSVKLNIKQIFSTFCIFSFCIIDWILGSQGGQPQVLCSNLVFTLLGMVIISHYNYRDFLAVPFYIWTLISVIALPLSIWWGKYNAHSYHTTPLQWYMDTINIVLWGYIIILTLRTFLIKKERPLINSHFLLLFGLFLLLVILSLNDNIWTIKYLIVLLFFYITPFTRKEHTDFISALLIGVILAFIFLQSVAFVIRPYDTLRYKGMYANENINSLFYQAVYCAFLGKFCLLHSNEENTNPSSTILKWLCFSFACAMWSFVFLTMCRSAMMGMGVVTMIAFVYYIKESRAHKLLSVLRFGACFMVVTILSFPTVYSAVRYLPAVFHRPAYFYNEYSVNKINSDDSFDSDKYTDWQDVIEENLGRFKDIINTGSSKNSSSQVLSVPLASTQNISIASVMADRSEMPLITNKKSTSYRIRIYSYYTSMLNLTGHLESENGIQVSEDYYAPHAHNLILQYCFNYGLPAGIIFIIIIVATVIKLLLDTFGKRKKENAQSIVALLFFTGIIVFGFTEIIWQRGQFSALLLYVIPYWTWIKRRT